MANIFKILLVAWPAVTALTAFRFYKKQNSQGAWTGGPISWPKSMWLAYTVNFWFLVPIFFLLGNLVPPPLLGFFYFHLISWWIRGPLELVMIYKWLNWTPIYGISHDLFHFFVCAMFLFFGVLEIDFSNPTHVLSFAFCIVILITTLAETLFAFLFLRARTQQEVDENVYFASEDPKWIFINRVTASVVIPAYIHFFLQSFFLYQLY